MTNVKAKEYIRSIQLQYYELLDAFYGDFYSQYLKSNLPPDEYLNTFLVKDKLHSICISQGKLLFENKYVEQIHNFLSVVTSFWKKHIHHMVSILQTFGNIGYFGTTENNTTSKYELTIKQNAVFFDLVALNDPFCALSNSDDKITAYSSVTYLFFESLISVFSIRSYVINEDDLIAAIIPINALIQFEEQEQLEEHAYQSSLDIAKRLFGIDYIQDNFVDTIKVLKGLSDKDITKTFTDNGIYINLSEAQAYEHYSLSIEDRQELINFSKTHNGDINWDLIRCIINYSAIPHILTTVLTIHATHSEAAKKANMSPIFNIFEWYPNKYYYENIPGSPGVSDQYKYMCAIQHNEKLAHLLQLDIHELLKFRSMNESSKFRQLFSNATAEIMYSPDQFSEIAESVFRKLNETINNINTERNLQHRINILSSLFGFGKAVCGFVPNISILLGIGDVGLSSYGIHKAMSKESDFIDHLIDSSSNIFNSKK